MISIYAFLQHKRSTFEYILVIKINFKRKLIGLLFRVARMGLSNPIKEISFKQKTKLDLSF